MTSKLKPPLNRSRPWPLQLNWTWCANAMTGVFAVGGLVHLSLSSPQFLYSSTLALLLISAALLSGIAMRPLARPDLLRTYRLISATLGVLLLLLASGFSAPTDTSAMGDYLWAQLFFLSRPLSLGCVIAAAIGYGLLPSRSDAKLAHCSHLLALTAGTLFLAGEIAGSYWAMQGWGHSWSWSNHFFFSALLYLLLVLVFHFPHRWFRGSRRQQMAKALLLSFIALLQLGYRLL
ncbi:hypothetical protein [Ferrimonas kyonanensis]|uniref:hypothetical protein n=1 Tax=Ferrimonas kyonanensis TaxID=364763 RepID=UPI000424EF65|nr:hypothetical protein [Ferrimonas kyonanensis]